MGKLNFVVKGALTGEKNTCKIPDSIRRMYCTEQFLFLSTLLLIFSCESGHTLTVGGDTTSFHSLKINEVTVDFIQKDNTIYVYQEPEAVEDMSLDIEVAPLSESSTVSQIETVIMKTPTEADGFTVKSIPFSITGSDGKTSDYLIELYLAKNILTGSISLGEYAASYAGKTCIVQMGPALSHGVREFVLDGSETQNFIFYGLKEDLWTSGVTAYNDNSGALSAGDLYGVSGELDMRNINSLHLDTISMDTYTALTFTVTTSDYDNLNGFVHLRNSSATKIDTLYGNVLNGEIIFSGIPSGVYDAILVIQTSGNYLPDISPEDIYTRRNGIQIVSGENTSVNLDYAEWNTGSSNVSFE